MSGGQSYVEFSKAQITLGKSSAAVTEAKLQTYLQQQPDLGGTILEITFDKAILKAGASSGTLLFDVTLQTQDGGTTTRNWVFRYDLGGVFFKQYALEPQYWVMKAVHAHGIPAPKVLWLDQAGEIAGYPGLIMERVSGAAPSMSPFAEGPLADAEPAGRNAMVLDAISVLARVHALGTASLGLEQYERRGSGKTFIDREINWLMRELSLALDHQLDGPSSVLYREQHATLTRVCDWLTTHAPRHRTPELTHGDSMVTNFMFEGHRVSALLDWENTHFGIGEVDIAYQLAGRDYFGLVAPPLEGLPTPDQALDHYRDARGKAEDWGYARVMGAWRAGLISVLGKSRLPANMDDFKRRSWSVTTAQLRDLQPVTGF